MRIGVDGRGFHSRRTGMEEEAFHRYRAMISAAPDDRFTVYVRGSDLVPPATSPNTEYRRIAPGGAAGAPLFFRWALPKALRRDRPDLFHTPYVTLPSVPDGVRTAITVHDLVVFDHPEWARGGTRAAQTGMRRSVERADGIVAVSKFTAERLRAVLGVSDAKIRVIPHGLAASFRRPGDAERDRVLARLGVAPGYVLFVGTIEPRKNVEGLLAAHDRLPAALRKKHPLVLAGKWGWKVAGLRKALETSPARAHVLGRVESDDLPALYSGAAVFAYASHYEGFGLPLLEAMGCGAPSVIAPREAMREVAAGAALEARDGSDAAFAEVMERVLSDYGLARGLAARGLARAASFTWERAGRETLAFFHELEGNQSS